MLKHSNRFRESAGSRPDLPERYLVDLALDPEVAPGIGGVARIIDRPVVGVDEVSGQSEEGGAMRAVALFAAACHETGNADEAEMEQAEGRSVLANSFHFSHLRYSGHSRLGVLFTRLSIERPG